MLVAVTSCASASNATVARCERQCDAASDCGSSSCLDKCEAEYDDATHIDCLDEYVEILECVDDVSDVCDVTACSNEIANYSFCLDQFCGTTPSDPLCGAPIGTGGGGGSEG